MPAGRWARQAMTIAISAFWACRRFSASSQAAEPGPCMLHSYLLAECQKHFNARRQAIAALKTPDDVRRRQKELHEHFLEALGGFPPRTPLNARTVGTLKGDGFRVDRVVYESRPNFHVPANLYIPLEGKPPDG